MALQHRRWLGRTLRCRGWAVSPCVPADPAACGMPTRTRCCDARHWKRVLTDPGDPDALAAALGDVVRYCLETKAPCR